MRHTAAYALLCIVVGVLRALPLDAALAIGRALGRVVGLFAAADTRSMRAALAAALDAPPPVGDCWADIGQRAAEWANARRMLARVDIDPSSEQHLHDALISGRGVIVATAHLGNWELMAAAVAARGVPVHSAASAGGRGRVFRWLAQWRAELGVHVHPPGGGARVLARRLRAGEIVAIFVDQSTRERCRRVPFFGRPAPTPITIERLAALSGASILLAWSTRQPDGRHLIRAEPVTACAGRLLEPLTQRIEALVRTAPVQWVWQHRRWAPRR